MNSFIYEIIKDLLAAWKNGKLAVRLTILISLVLICISTFFYLYGTFTHKSKEITNVTSGFIATIAATMALIVIVNQKYQEDYSKERKIKEVETRLKENPKETQAAWELARVKLESYLNRNLNQIRSIYWLTIVTMLVGFFLIGTGVYKAFNLPGSMQASLIASVSGIVINFIGATFIIIYKSTMKQSSEYVNILERINAVGMSVQILENIDSNETAKLKAETTAELAKQLLLMYSNSNKGK
jgi:hypothetical protein